MPKAGAGPPQWVPAWALAGISKRSLMFSDSVFAQASEDAIVDLLNNVEVYGAKTFALDSSTDVGKQVYSLGGIVALLRYELR